MTEQKRKICFSLTECNIFFDQNNSKLASEIPKLPYTIIKALLKTRKKCSVPLSYNTGRIEDVTVPVF